MRKAFLALVLLAGPVSAQEEFNATYSLTIEQVTSLNATPVAVEAAQAGFAYQLVSYSIVRNGPRYETQPGHIQLRIPGGGARYVDLGCANCLTLVGPDPNRYAYVGVSSFVGAATDGANHYGSKGVELFANAGSPTVTEANPGAPLVIRVRWRLMPTYAETVPE